MGITKIKQHNLDMENISVGSFYNNVGYITSSSVPTIPSTPNLLAGDGAGNVVDAGFFITDGSDGQILTTDGGGNLSFITLSTSINAQNAAIGSFKIDGSAPFNASSGPSYVFALDYGDGTVPFAIDGSGNIRLSSVNLFNNIDLLGDALYLAQKDGDNMTFVNPFGAVVTESLTANRSIPVTIGATTYKLLAHI